MEFGKESSAQAGALLQSAEIRFQHLLEKLPAGAYTCDREGLITYFNPHAVELWGRAPALNDPADRFCGSFKLFTTDGAPIRHDQCWMALALRDGREYNGHEIVIERPDGQRLTTLAHANPIRDASDALVGAVNVLVDISARKRAEQSLMDADRRKNEFLAVLAHELRNPLAPIRIAAQVLRLRGAGLPELGEPLDVIERQMQQMTRLIDDLLDVSRITRDALELRKERTDVAEVLRAALEINRPLIEAGGQELVVTEWPEPLSLEADPTRLAQVVSNLLNNAAKYTRRDDRILLSVERAGDHALVTVRDTGIGIPAALLPRVFDMFTQAEPGSERTRDGLGIGLTLAKRLVELHGGAIEARSDGPGRGSEFVVRLPLATEPLASGRPAARKRRALPRLSLRILVVDDNRDSAESLAMLLRLTGNDVRVAHDGLEAVALAQEHDFDVAVLDIGLPKLDGYAAAHEIRRRAQGDPLLIAVTGWGQSEDRERARAAGFDHHLVKPVDPSALLALLAARVRAPAGTPPDPASPSPRA